MKVDVQGQGGGIILHVAGQGGREVLKIGLGQFLWTSYVYHPLPNLEKWIQKFLFGLL